MSCSLKTALQKKKHSTNWTCEKPNKSILNASIQGHSFLKILRYLGQVPTSVTILVCEVSMGLSWGHNSNAGKPLIV